MFIYIEVILRVSIKMRVRVMITYIEIIISDESRCKKYNLDRGFCSMYNRFLKMFKTINYLYIKIII